MRFNQSVCRLLCSVLSLMLALAPGASLAEAPVAAPAAEQGPLAVDIALQADGLLVGQLVGASGKPTADAKVHLKLADGREAEAKTNAKGGFAFKGVRGVAQLQTDKALVVVRGWSPGAAPPNAVPAILLVEGDEVARGQHYAGSRVQTATDYSKRLFANPLLVAGIVGTAVAIPVAIHNSDDNDPAS